MKIVLIILSVIGLLLLFLIICPFSVRILYRDEVNIYIGYFFPLIRVFTTKEKTEEQLKAEEEKKKKKENKKKKKQAAEEKTESEEKAKKENIIARYKRKHGLSGLIDLIKELAEIVLKMTKMITDNLVISRLDIDMVIVGEDSADTAIKYGYACSAVFPAVAVIEQHVRQCRHRERITAGFLDTETKLCLDLKARIIPVFILIAGVQALIRALKALAK